MPRSTPDYNTGPPTTVGEGPDDSGTPADTTGTEVEGESESPHTPPANTDTIVEPGGSPSDDAIAAVDPTITGLDPTTAVADSGAVSLTVTGTNFRDDSVVEVNQSEVPTTYVSDTELTADFPGSAEAATVSVTVRNPTSEQESNGFDFTFTAAEE